jgi:hypothetical protein
MVSLRLRTRRPAASVPAFYEPTPYCDRLTLAEGFAADLETRPTAEDRRVEHKPVGSCVEVLDDVVAHALGREATGPSPAPRRRWRSASR